MSLQYLQNQSLNISCNNLECSTINGNPVNPGNQNLADTLTEGNNANNLTIENLETLNLQNSGNTSSVDLTTSAGDVFSIYKGGSSQPADVTAGTINCTSMRLVDANNIKLDNSSGFDPEGDPVNTLTITNGSGGSAQLNVGSLQVGLLEIQSAQNQLYFVQNLDTGTVGTVAGRIPIFCNETVYYLQVYNVPPPPTLF